MKKSDIAFILIGIFGIAVFVAYWLSRPEDSKQTAALQPAAKQFDPLKPQPAQPAPPQNQPAINPQQIAALIAQLMQPNAAAADHAADQLTKIGAPALVPLSAARAATQDVLLQARIDAVTRAITAQPHQPMAAQPPATPQPVVPNLAVPLPQFAEQPLEPRTTNIRTFTTADGKTYRVTQITEGNKSKLTIEISNAAGQPIERVEAANETELARTHPQLAAILRQNEGVGDREQIVQGPGIMRRVTIRGGGGAVVLNIGGGGLFGNRGTPLPNMPRPEAPASAPVGDFGARLAETADGVRVIEVAPNSRAAASGLQAADLIVKINGRQVNSLDDANDLIQKADPAQPLKLEITRRGEIVSLP